MGDCLSDPLGIREKGGLLMTDYELISLIIAIASLMISVVILVIKLFAFLDTRYQKKRK